jgi:hypothetical protein
MRATARGCEAFALPLGCCMVVAHGSHDGVAGFQAFSPSTEGTINKIALSYSVLDTSKDGTYDFNFPNLFTSQPGPKAAASLFNLAPLFPPLSFAHLRISLTASSTPLTITVGPPLAISPSLSVHPPFP